MNRLKLYSGILLIFILGVLAGSLGTGLFVKYKLAKISQNVDPPPAKILRRFAEKLDISNGQRKEIDKILNQSRSEWIEIRQKYHPEFQKVFENSIARIKENLNSKQKQKLDRLYGRLERRHRDGQIQQYRMHIAAA